MDCSIPSFSLLHWGRLPASLAMEGVSDAQALWNLLGRGSAAGKRLFQLYHPGDARATDLGQEYSNRNRAILAAKKKKAPGEEQPPSSQ